MILRTIGEVREWRSNATNVCLVPTMGALHEGHLSLIRRSARDGPTVVSIFVNPTQFGPNEDFSRYPKPFDRDYELAMEARAEAVFAPAPEEIYMEGWQTTVRPGALAEGLCGPFRPGHFAGVATVVCKLFNIVQPDRAYFGEKDFQQLRIIEQMVSDLEIPTQIVRCSTVREPDGLAMSSRNAYLSPDDRRRALTIYQALQAAQQAVQSGERSTAAIEGLATEVIDAVRIDYIHVVDSITLQRIESLDAESRLCIAAWIGNTRLIDNSELRT